MTWTVLIGPHWSDTDLKSTARCPDKPFPSQWTPSASQTKLPAPCKEYMWWSGGLSRASVTRSEPL